MTCGTLLEVVVVRVDDDFDVCLLEIELLEVVVVVDFEVVDVFAVLVGLVVVDGFVVVLDFAVEVVVADFFVVVLVFFVEVLVVFTETCEEDDFPVGTALVDVDVFFVVLAAKTAPVSQARPSACSHSFGNMTATGSLFYG